MSISGYFNQLRRRNIFRIAGVYVVVSWLIIQLAIALETALNLPGWFDTVVTTLVLIGFPIAMIVTWGLELTPDGDVKTSNDSDAEAGDNSPGASARFDIAIVLGILAVIGLIIWQGIDDSTTFDTVEQPVQPADQVDMAAATTSDSEIEAKSSLSIAVLPFEDFSPGKDQDYFADGISEELLNSLAKIKDLHVTSRTSAFSFKGSNTSVSEIGEILGVAHVLEGSIRKAGKTLRITAQLINTQTDAHLWSETYDRTLSIDNIFAIQDEISAAIVTELKGKLNIDEIKPAAVPNSLLAYDLYLRARDNMRKRTPESLQAALVDYQRVIELDNNFAPAFADIAEVHVLMVGYSGADYINAIKLARSYIDRAVELASNSEETLLSQAQLFKAKESYPNAIEYAKKAIKVNPSLSDSFHYLSYYYGHNGSPLESIRAAEKSVELDPLFYVPQTNMALIYGRIGKIQRALEILAPIKGKGLSHHSVFMWSGVVSNLSGDYTTGHSEFLKAWSKAKEAGIIFAGMDPFYWLYIDIGIWNLDGSQPREEFSQFTLLEDGSTYRASVLDYGTIRSEHTVSYLAGDFAEADRVISEYRSLYRQPGAEPGIWSIDYWIEVFMISQTVGHEDTDLLGQRIQDYINKFPESVDLSSLALFSALKVDYSEAMTFFEDHVDAGHATWRLRLPVFDAVRETDRFKAIQQRNDDNAAAIRAIVFEQMEAYDREHG